MRKGEKYPVEILTDEEVQRMMAACGRRSSTGIRNRAAIAIMYRAGLRVSEVRNLMPKDWDARAGTIRILLGKGRKSRTVGIDPVACTMVEIWMEERRQLGLGEQHHMFCTLRGQRLVANYFRGAMKRIAKKAKITKRVHPHAFRHSHASQLAAEGVPINVISMQLGHSGSAITSRYIDHINPTEVIEVARNREWKIQD